MRAGVCVCVWGGMRVSPWRSVSKLKIIGDFFLNLLSINAHVRSCRECIRQYFLEVAGVCGRYVRHGGTNGGADACEETTLLPITDDTPSHH